MTAAELIEKLKAEANKSPYGLSTNVALERKHKSSYGEWRLELFERDIGTTDGEIRILVPACDNDWDWESK